MRLFEMQNDEIDKRIQVVFSVISYFYVLIKWFRLVTALIQKFLHLQQCYGSQYLLLIT